MARELAIDLGTSTTQVYARGRGVIFTEPTVAAVDARTHAILAVGGDAYELIGRTPGQVVAVRPLSQGAIVDFDITERLLEVVLRRAGASRVSRPKVLMAVPTAITEVERRALRSAIDSAGASDCFLIEYPMAAAIGVGLPIHEPTASMVVDVGGGTTEAAVISLGGVVAQSASRSGGLVADVAIQSHVRNSHGLVIGERVAEEIKIAIGSALPFEGEQSAEVKGRDVDTGALRTVELSAIEVRKALSTHVAQVVATATDCLGSAPAQLAPDIIEEGIYMVGGASQLRGLAQRLAEATTVPIYLAESPANKIVEGAGRCVEEFETLRALFAKR